MVPCLLSVPSTFRALIGCLSFIVLRLCFRAKFWSKNIPLALQSRRVFVSIVSSFSLGSMSMNNDNEFESFTALIE